MQTLASTLSSVVTRSSLQMNNISAQLKSDDLFVSPYTIVSTYYLRNESNYYNSIPVYFKLNNHNVTNAFLRNNNLREVVFNELRTACNLAISNY